MLAVGTATGTIMAGAAPAGVVSANASACSAALGVWVVDAIAVVDSDIVVDSGSDPCTTADADLDNVAVACGVPAGAVVDVGDSEEVVAVARGG